MKYLLITYNISRLKNSNRARFVYLLKGRRGEEGLITKYRGKFLAPGCFMIPINHKEELKKLFKQWNVKAEILNITVG